MVDSEFHHDMQHGISGFNENQMIKDNADSIMRGLRDKALANAEKTLNEKRALNLAKFFVMESK